MILAKSEVFWVYFSHVKTGLTSRSNLTCPQTVCESQVQPVQDINVRVRHKKLAAKAATCQGSRPASAGQHLGAWRSVCRIRFQTFWFISERGRCAPHTHHHHHHHHHHHTRGNSRNDARSHTLFSLHPSLSHIHCQHVSYDSPASSGPARMVLTNSA